jgi:hypothetical protein
MGFPGDGKKAKDPTDEIGHTTITKIKFVKLIQIISTWN